MPILDTNKCKPKVVEDVTPIRVGHVEWVNPPPTSKIKSRLTELINSRRGHVTIIAVLLHQPKNKNRGLRLLGRCDCGKYVSRSARSWRRSLRSNNTQFESCERCSYIHQLKKWSR